MGQAADPIRYPQTGARTSDVSYYQSGAPSPQMEAYQPIAQDPDAIRGQIEHTRMEMSQTIDAIQHRLSPAYLKQQAKDQIRETIHETRLAAVDGAKGVGTTMLERIKQNPIPAAIAALSIGWMMRKGTDSGQVRRGEYRYASDEPYYEAYEGTTPYYPTGSEQGAMQRAQERMGEMTGQMQEGVGQMAGQARDSMGRMADTVGDMTSKAQHQVSTMASQAGEGVGDLARATTRGVGQVGDQVGHYGRQVQRQASRMGDRVGQMMETNPLALGAVAMAVGSAVGLTLPSTRMEHQMMGEARDNMMDRAGEMARDTMHKVEDVAQEAQRAVGEEARRQGLVT